MHQKSREACLAFPVEPQCSHALTLCMCGALQSQAPPSAMKKKVVEGEDGNETAHVPLLEERNQLVQCFEARDVRSMHLQT